ncbi:hypothetical protein DFH28DRAFT_1122240 [Melampsora americana]|nr:hypothetical protein DFH28DRAFT_1122240 [Melampsora americana]
MTFDDLYQKELNRNQAQAQAQTQAQNQASNHTEELELSPAEFIQTFQYRLDDLIVKSKYLLDNGISALNRNFILTDDEDEDEDDVEEEEEEEEEEEDEDESKLEKGVVKSKTNLNQKQKQEFINNSKIPQKSKKFNKRNSSCNTTNPRHESYASSSSLRSVLIKPMISTHTIHPHHPTRFQSNQSTKSNLESIQKNHQTLLRLKPDSDPNTIKNKTKKISQLFKSTSISFFQNLISFSHHFSKVNLSSRYQYNSIPNHSFNPQNSRQSTQPFSSGYVSFPPYSSHFKSKWFNAT